MYFWRMAARMGPTFEGPPATPMQVFEAALHPGWYIPGKLAVVNSLCQDLRPVLFLFLTLLRGTFTIFCGAFPITVFITFTIF